MRAQKGVLVGAYSGYLLLHDRPVQNLELKPAIIPITLFPGFVSQESRQCRLSNYSDPYGINCGHWVVLSWRLV